MKIKNQSSLPSKYWLLIIAVVCILLMGIEHFTGHAGPVTFVANYTVIPMEKGISYAGTWMSDVSKNFQTMKDMTKENKKLQKKVDELTTDNTRLRQEQYELAGSSSYTNWMKTTRIIRKSERMSLPIMARTGSVIL